jgi:hypothetical protein
MIFAEFAGIFGGAAGVAMTGRGVSKATATAPGVPPAAAGSAGARRRVCSAAAFTSTFVAIAGLLGYPARAENPEIGVRRAAERTSFTDDEISRGFFKIAFGAELQFDRQVERIRKFDEPVRVFVVDHGRSDDRAKIAQVVADIRARIEHLDIAMADDRTRANVVVRLVRNGDLKRTIQSLYGRDKSKQIQRSLAPQCLSGIAKDARYRVRRAEVILPVDAGEFVFYDCAYEELLQALGPINDDSSVPWTMFNDDVQMGFFDVYDQFLLNILYDPRVRPGMTKVQVDKLLPDVLPDVRAWLAARDARTRNSSNADRETHAQSRTTANGVH